MEEAKPGMDYRAHGMTQLPAQMPPIRTPPPRMPPSIVSERISVGLFDFFRKNKTAPTNNSRNAAQATSVPRELLVSDHEVDNQIFAILAEHVDMTAPRE